jgi:hypothetical protein
MEPAHALRKPGERPAHHANNALQVHPTATTTTAAPLLDITTLRRIPRRQAATVSTLRCSRAFRTAPSTQVCGSPLLSSQRHAHSKPRHHGDKRNGVQLRDNITEHRQHLQSCMHPCDEWNARAGDRDDIAAHQASGRLHIVRIVVHGHHKVQARRADRAQLLGVYISSHLPSSQCHAHSR